jgi:methyl-accepting chemotaxis protein
MSEHGHTSANHELLWRSIGQVITALSLGDFTTKVSSEALAGVPEDSEPAQVAHRLNTMAGQLNEFAAEATRVSREIGTEGFFGCQMDVPGLNGTWKDLADNTNLMARNLTNQVRNIAQVITAVANGDLSRKVTVDADGEML